LITRDYLPEIITETLKGDLIDALECVTIVENFEGSPEEEELNESLVILGDYLTAHKKNHRQKLIC